MDENESFGSNGEFTYESDDDEIEFDEEINEFSRISQKSIDERSVTNHNTSLDSLKLDPNSQNILHGWY